MTPNNLTFSSKINPQIEDFYFDVLFEHVKNWNDCKMYVWNVVTAPFEIIFFVKIDGSESIIRVPTQND